MREGVHLSQGSMFVRMRGRRGLAGVQTEVLQVRCARGTRDKRGQCEGDVGDMWREGEKVKRE